MEYALYLFDFDYTLVDSSRGIVMVFREVMKLHNHPYVTDEQIKRTIGMPVEDSFALLTGVEDKELLAQYRREMVPFSDKHMVANTKPFPGVAEVLLRLKAEGAKLGIISTKLHHRIVETLNTYFPDNLFDIVVGGDDVTYKKPNPEGILRAIGELQIPLDDVVYVGDSIIDAQAAKNAGVDFIGILNGVTTRDELEAFPHRRVIGNINELY